jgi:hypothetical protein
MTLGSFEKPATEDPHRGENTQALDASQKQELIKLGRQRKDAELARMQENLPPICDASDEECESFKRYLRAYYEHTYFQEKVNPPFTFAEWKEEKRKADEQKSNK